MPGKNRTCHDDAKQHNPFVPNNIHNQANPLAKKFIGIVLIFEESSLVFQYFVTFLGGSILLYLNFLIFSRLHIIFSLKPTLTIFDSSGKI